MAVAGRSTNPFMDDDDDEQFSFGNRHRHQPSKATNNYGVNEFGESRSNNDWTGRNPEMSRLGQLLAEADASESRTLDSTQRCLASIYESEAMGVETAKELIHQGEQLENTEKRLDDINEMTKTSQKHLNSIKSVFGGIKSWFTKEKKPEPVPEKESASDRAAKLQVTMSRSEAMGADRPHPALSRWDEDERRDDLYDEASGYGSKSGRQAYRGVSAARNTEIDENLGMMSDGLGRLKSLALGLQGEIDAQDEVIRRVMEKTGRADDTVTNQNAQMKKILR